MICDLIRSRDVLDGVIETADAAMNAAGRTAASQLP
jgi:hypothetical protein